MFAAETFAFLDARSGLVYLDTFETVGGQEHQDQVERSGNRN